MEKGGTVELVGGYNDSEKFSSSFATDSGTLGVDKAVALLIPILDRDRDIRLSASLITECDSQRYFVVQCLGKYRLTWRACLDSVQDTDTEGHPTSRKRILGGVCLQLQ